MEKLSIIFVDDDEAVLVAIKRILFRYSSIYDLEFATNAEDALALICSGKKYFAVVADMFMTGDDGIVFLSKVKEIDPAIIRILMSGRPDVGLVIASINKSKIWQFICKPFKPEDLVKIVYTAFDTYNESEQRNNLLVETLDASVQSLLASLAYANKPAAASSERICSIVKELVKHLQLLDSKLFERAALLSQMGAIQIPKAVYDKKYAYEKLTEDEEAHIANIAKISYELININPSLSLVAEIVLRQGDRFDERRAVGDYSLEHDIFLGADILSCAVGLDNILTSGYSKLDAIALMYKDEGLYNPLVLSVMPLVNIEEAGESGVEIKISDLKAGMILAQNVHAKTGLLLAQSGQEITGKIKMMFLKYYGRENLHDTFLIAPYKL